MRLTRIISILCYYLGIDALFYRLNRRAKRIITFHNILPKELWRANLANGVSHSLEDFVFIVDRVSRHYRFSTDLMDAKTATLTFDDGYHNQYAFAFKVLREKGISAILFVSGDLCGETRSSNSTALLIDRYLHWVSCAPTELIPGGDRFRYWTQSVWPRFLKAGESNGSEVFRELDLKFPFAEIESNIGERYCRERLCGIAYSELAEMRNAGWLIGWHTKSHRPLGSLKEMDISQELDSPAEFRNVCLSYPFGNPEEVGEVAIRLAEEMGYPCAVSDTNSSTLNRTTRYFLPRMELGSANKYDVEFALSGARHFLKYRRLLP